MFIKKYDYKYPKQSIEKLSAIFWKFLLASHNMTMKVLRVN